MSKVKIFISYKNKNELLKSDILVPIQTGRAISDEVFDHMIGDDTGDNISERNPRYNELTAQYWVWKHYQEIGNPDYVGFMHYRRQFIFDKELKHTQYTWVPKSKQYYVNSIYDGYEKHFSKEKIMYKFADGTDCITYKKFNIRPRFVGHNMEEYFVKGLEQQKIETFRIFEQIIKEYYKDYIDTFDEFKKGHHMYYCNSFVMKKELFFEYNEFLFGILAKVDELINSSDFNEKENRFLGFLGEYIFTIFMFQKLKNQSFKLKELPGTFVSDYYKQLEFKKKKYRILMSITFGKKRRYYMKKYIKNNMHYVKNTRKS
ncbi:MAG: DUF4422 domain-containing protein [Candidatus Gastranaerophilales bacterium]